MLALAGGQQTTGEGQPHREVTHVGRGAGDAEQHGRHRVRGGGDREHAEQEGEGRHQDGAEARPGGLEGGLDQVQAGEAMLRKENCQAVIAVGGGSVLDAGKMIAMLHTNPWPLEKFDGVQKCKKPSLPLFAVPTTAGTGSEITLAAVITDPVAHRKVPVADTKLIPSYVALDPEIMKGMPPAITAATGMDALTHAVESYLSKASTESTEMQARTAVRLIFQYLVRAFQDGSDMEAREAMALGSFYAGAAFSRTSVGYVHGIAHQLGRVCGTPHGNANAMVLPEVLAAYGDCVHPRLADLARLVGLGSAGDNEAQYCPEAKSLEQDDANSRCREKRHDEHAATHSCSIEPLTGNIADGEDLVKLGKHKFSVNAQPIALALAPRGDALARGRQQRLATGEARRIATGESGKPDDRQGIPQANLHLSRAWAWPAASPCSSSSICSAVSRSPAAQASRTLTMGSLPGTNAS